MLKGYNHYYVSLSLVDVIYEGFLFPTDRWEERTFGAPLANVLRTALTALDAAVPTLPRALLTWACAALTAPVAWLRVLPRALVA